MVWDGDGGEALQVQGHLGKCNSFCSLLPPINFSKNIKHLLNTSDGSQTATEQDLKSIGLFCLLRFKIHGTLLSSYLLKTLMKSLKLRYGVRI